MTRSEFAHFLFGAVTVAWLASLTAFAVTSNWFLFALAMTLMAAGFACSGWAGSSTAKFVPDRYGE